MDEETYREQLLELQIKILEKDREIKELKEKIKEYEIGIEKE